MDKESHDSRQHYYPWFVYGAAVPRCGSKASLWEIVSACGEDSKVLLHRGPSLNAPVIGYLSEGMQVYGRQHGICGQTWLRLSRQIMSPPVGQRRQFEIQDEDDMWFVVSPDIPTGAVIAQVNGRLDESRTKTFGAETWRVLKLVQPALDGYWIDAAGNEIASVLGDVMYWKHGAELIERAQHTLSTNVADWGVLDMAVDENGCLIWSDGDVWMRSGSDKNSTRNYTPTASRTTILLVRHGERVDDAQWFFEGTSWVKAAERPWDPPLTANGRLQARALGRKVMHHVNNLKIAPVTHIFSSPFERCFETAAVAAAEMGLAKICIEPSLCEGLGEEFFRSWAVPGADGTWGGPPTCPVGVAVERHELRPGACGSVEELVPKERLRQCLGSDYASIDDGYIPWLKFSSIKYTWGNFESEMALEMRMHHFFNWVATQFQGQTVMLVSHAGPTQALYRKVMPLAPIAPCGYCCLFALSKDETEEEETWTSPVVPAPTPSVQPLVGEIDEVIRISENEKIVSEQCLQQVAVKQRIEECERLARELFDWFDYDKDGFWCWREASQFVATTLGVKMPEQQFVTLLAAVSGGRQHLSKIGVRRGLSREQVVALYTDLSLNRHFPMIFNVRRDHAIVFTDGQVPVPCKACGDTADMSKSYKDGIEELWFCSLCWSQWDSCRADEPFSVQKSFAQLRSQRRENKQAVIAPIGTKSQKTCEEKRDIYQKASVEQTCSSQPDDFAVPSLEDLLQKLDLEDQAEAAPESGLTRDAPLQRCGSNATSQESSLEARSVARRPLGGAFSRQLAQNNLSDRNSNAHL